MRYTTTALMLLALAAPLHAGEPPKVSFTEIPITRLIPGYAYDSLRISADHRHAAFAAPKKGKWVVVLDGKESGEYEWIGPSTVRLWHLLFAGPL